MTAVAALILAAGRSERMGSANKLLCPVEGRAMVARVADAALASRARPVAVVTGPEPDAIRAALAGLAVAFVSNSDPAEGMASSLRAGVSALESLNPPVDGALVCLGDMPWVAAAHLDALIDAFDPAGGQDLCAPVYEERRGHPVLLGARYFPEMQALRGDVGAREILERHPDRLVLVPVGDPGVLRDVDTEEALSPLH